MEWLKLYKTKITRASAVSVHNGLRVRHFYPRPFYWIIKNPNKMFFFPILLNVSNDVILSLYLCMMFGLWLCLIPFLIKQLLLITIKHSCKLTPVLIQEMRSHIKHNHNLYSISCQQTDNSWVMQLRSQRCIETSKLRLYKISSSSKNRTKRKNKFMLLFL